jgi:hypothetical protein
MAVLLKTGWLFVHIPKTGGTWLRCGLAEAGVAAGEEADPGVAPWPVLAGASAGMRRCHATARSVGHDPARSFCFVRHPLAWYRSLWAHGARDGWEPGEFALDQYGCDDFTEFMDRCLRAFPTGFVSHLYRVYTEGVGFVGRFERLGEDLHGALALAGLGGYRGFTHSPLNVASALPHLGRRCLYPRHLAERVAEVEREAIARFGYQPVPEELVGP